MGTELYNRVLKILRMHRDADSDYQKIANDLKLVTGKNKKLKDLCFSLEQIVFMGA